MIYLDNASTTKIDDRVLEAMVPYLTESYGNAGTLYDLGRRSANAITRAREQIADLIGAKPEQIIFTSGGSEANNMILCGLARHLHEHCRMKSWILTSAIEHDSVLKTTDHYDMFYNHVEYLFPDSRGKIILDESTKEWIKNNAGLVSVMHTNNETGIETGVGEIGKFCHETGILFHTDCVQAAGCAPLNVDVIQCDFMSLSAHKIHGPKGVGALYARDKSILSPLINGGKSQEFGLRGGTENVAGIVGFGKACEIAQQNLAEDAEYIRWLRQRLYDLIKARLKQHGLDAILHINGDINLVTDNGKTMSIRFDGVDAETLLLMLDSFGVCVSAGSACRSHESEPSRVLLAMGISPDDARNSIRLSVSRMNTLEEVEQAAKIIVDCVLTLRC